MIDDGAWKLRSLIISLVAAGIIFGVTAPRVTTTTEMAGALVGSLIVGYVASRALSGDEE